MLISEELPWVAEKVKARICVLSFDNTPFTSVGFPKIKYILEENVTY